MENQEEESRMLDILDKQGRVVAVILDNGTVVKKEKTTDDLEAMIKEKISSLGKERK